jgi:hypothetical protein
MHACPISETAKWGGPQGRAKRLACPFRFGCRNESPVWNEELMVGLSQERFVERFCGRVQSY